MFEVAAAEEALSQTGLASAVSVDRLCYEEMENCGDPKGPRENLALLEPHVSGRR